MRRSSNTLAVIRRSKLDLAKWITAGIVKCPSVAVSHCLARYASEQLMSAALIPVMPPQQIATMRDSLLHRELAGKGARSSTECVRILASVSRSMEMMLTAESIRVEMPSRRMHLQQLAARERRAAAFLRAA